MLPWTCLLLYLWSVQDFSPLPTPSQEGIKKILPVDHKIVFFLTRKREKNQHKKSTPPNHSEPSKYNISSTKKNQVSLLRFTRMYWFHMNRENMMNAFMLTLFLYPFCWHKQNLSQPPLYSGSNLVSKARIIFYEAEFCVNQWGWFCLVPIKLRKLANITKFNSKQLISPDRCYY